jgi:hypothetical protein
VIFLATSLKDNINFWQCSASVLQQARGNFFLSKKETNKKES